MSSTPLWMRRNSSKRGWRKPARAASCARPSNSFTTTWRSFRKTLVATRKGGFIAGEEQLREELTSLYGAVNGYEGTPTDSQVQNMEALEARLKEAEEKLASLIAEKINSLGDRLKAGGLEPVKAMSKEDWRAKESNR